MHLSMARLAGTAALLSGCSALLLHSNSSASEDGLADQQLIVKKLRPGTKCLGGWNAVNPSFVAVPGTSTLAVAFRGLCMQRPGSPPVKHAYWYNTLVIGTLPKAAMRSSKRGAVKFDSLAIAPDPRLKGVEMGMQPCHFPASDDHHDHSQGPEDPRLVTTSDGMYVLVNGRTLVQNGGVCGEHAILIHAAKVQSLNPPRFGPPVQLKFPGMGAVEKNWAVFRGDSSGATQRAVYSIYPHSILSVNLKTGHSEFIAHTKSAAVEKLAKKLGVKPSDFHGGAGVAHGKDAKYMFSVLHVAMKGEGWQKTYWNYPYKFSAKAPYKILAIGKKLPLKATANPAYKESLVSFVTTVMFDKGHIFIGYGSGDRSSRTFRMPENAFMKKYFPSSLLQESGAIEDVLDHEAELGANHSRSL